jgi:phenylpropionate dioxygenase-like ring-hydroxylating dioxygenase large terminal subunit
MFVRNAWYVAALSTDIKAELFARTIANERIVMYRTSEGKIAALEDRCAHRQVPLSKGCLQGDQVQCWYHGLHFDETGKCVHIPSQSNIPQRASVRSFPVAERYSFVWLWLGDPALCDGSSIPDHSVCVSPKHAGEMYYAHARTDYRLGIDNFLDSSHVAFVHPGTVESQAVSEARPEMEIQENRVCVRRRMYKEKSSPLFQKMMGLAYIDRIQDCIFWPVGNTRIDSTVHPPGEPNGPALRTFTLGLFTPESETSCHLWAGIYRDFAIDNQQLSQLIAQQLRAIIEQDVNVVEHAQANWSEAASIVHLEVDQASIAARQILDHLLRKEYCQVTESLR